MNNKFRELVEQAIKSVDIVTGNELLNDELAKMYIPDCFAEKFALSILTSGLYAEWQNELGAENIQVMPADTDWTNVNWGLADE